MNIHPLGEQIIIRTLPPDRVGSIIIPDAAKTISKVGKEDPTSAINFVEAEVIAVGPGKRLTGDETLVSDLLYALDFVWDHQNNNAACDGYPSRIADLHRRAVNRCARLPPLVQPGDKILYHPAVQTYDRDITDIVSAALDNGNDLNGSKYFIIREGSVLAVLEKESE